MLVAVLMGRDRLHQVLSGGFQAFYRDTSCAVSMATSALINAGVKQIPGRPQLLVTSEKSTKHVWVEDGQRSCCHPAGRFLNTLPFMVFYGSCGRTSVSSSQNMEKLRMTDWRSRSRPRSWTSVLLNMIFKKHLVRYLTLAPVLFYIHSTHFSIEK